MRDVLWLTQTPVIFFHSGAYSVTPHLRNVPDDVLHSTHRNGGIVMVVFVNRFLNMKDLTSVTLYDVADHIWRLAKIAGWDHVRIGVGDVKDLHQDLLIPKTICIEDEISKFRDPTKDFANYTSLFRPLQKTKSLLHLPGSGSSSSHKAAIGRRRYAYHEALQTKLRHDITHNVNKPCIQGNVLKDPESKGWSEGELLSISMSMMAGADTTKCSVLWGLLLLAHHPDIQDKAYVVILQAGLLDAVDAAHLKVQYIEAFVKKVDRYFIVQRLALPKATYSHDTDPDLFADPTTFAPERWRLDGDDQTANRHRHQYAFGIGSRTSVASHVATKALYIVFSYVIAHFRVLPASLSHTSDEVDPVLGLSTPEILSQHRGHDASIFASGCNGYDEDARPRALMDFLMIDINPS
ncbi:putative Cytochrome P450 2H2 [Seiridium unicorne]|uniref:Dipeptidase n=1 Tax=Seiridium unicorne TaxID=138068 RepID=A0ABR2V4L3_9PEZI